MAVFQSIIRLDRKQEILKTPDVSIRFHGIKCILFQVIYSVVLIYSFSAFFKLCNDINARRRMFFSIALSLNFCIPLEKCGIFLKSSDSLQSCAHLVRKPTGHLLPIQALRNVTRLFVRTELFNLVAGNKTDVKEIFVTRAQSMALCHQTHSL